eukprot:scaffold12749_cov107-Cylindrotheca_fusiformis.AAC.3
MMMAKRRSQQQCDVSRLLRLLQRFQRTHSKDIRRSYPFLFGSNVIGKWAFRGCWKLKSILHQGLEKEEVGISSNGIPSTFKLVEGYAFCFCNLLARLGLNGGREQRIGQGAFHSCEFLTEVDVPSTFKVIDEKSVLRMLSRRLNEGLEEIGEYSMNANS